MSQIQIFKVQRGLNPGARYRVLIYNKAKTIFLEKDLRPSEVIKMFGDKDKIFVKGYIDRDGVLQIFPEEKLPAEPDW